MLDYLVFGVGGTWSVCFSLCMRVAGVCMLAYLYYIITQFFFGIGLVHWMQKCKEVSEEGEASPHYSKGLGALSYR